MSSKRESHTLPVGLHNCAVQQLRSTLVRVCYSSIKFARLGNLVIIHIQQYNPIFNLTCFMVVTALRFHISAGYFLDSDYL